MTMSTLKSNLVLLTLALFVCSNGAVRYSFNHVTLSVMRKEQVHGTRKTFTVDADPSRIARHQASSYSEVEHEMFSRVRRDTTGYQPEHKVYHFNDSHFVAEVHWSGSNSSVILMLMRDPKPTASRPSNFYVSRDYGATFTDVSYKFKLPNNTVAVINDYFPSPIDNKMYILTAKFHKYIYVSTDECQSFTRHSLTFSPTKLVYHPVYKRYVLGFDEDHPKNQLYVSTNFGVSWTMKSQYVRKFYWGKKPYDYGSTMFIERRLPGRNTSDVLKTYSWWWYRRTLITGALEFELVDQYMFATKFNSTRNEVDLLVSNRRRSFQVAMFPLRLPKKSFIVADASEDQVFVAVNHGNKITNLYISDAPGKSFTLSLSRVLYYHKEEPSQLRPYVNHSFIDLYRVQSVYGVYIANQVVLIKGRSTSRSLITFDKGGKWDPIKAPSFNKLGRPTNCRVTKNCSLHISQEYAYHNPYTRFQPVFSRKSAPGLILATGSLGSTLTTRSPNVYMSPDAGVTWKEVLRGHWYYRFADHGGVIVAVPRYGVIDTLQYSWNEGITWLSYKFSSIKYRVYGLLTEPGEKSTVFTIFGSLTGRHSWLIIQVNMTSVLGKPCTSSDYKNWTVSDERERSDRCLLGRKQSFEKRDPKSRCFNGYNYDRPVLSFNCPCTREDFECDFGFKPQWRGWFERYCVDDPYDRVDPLKTPTYCPPGTFYNKTRGYRKISGDTCSGGEENRYSPIPTACPVQEAKTFLLYAVRTTIRRLGLVGKTSEIRFRINGLVNAVALDFDYKNNYLYWGDITTDRIQRVHLNGSGFVETIVAFNESRSHVEAVVYDWMGNNIFWVDPGMKVIGVVKASDGFVRKVLIQEKLNRPRALVLDPQNGYMYWTDWGSPAKIEKAQLDGKGRKAIISTGLYWPNGITIDHARQKLYWTDAGRDRIETADVDGKGRKTVLSTNVPHPFAITFLENNLYWDDWSSRSIETASTSGTQRKTLKRYLSGIMDLKSYSPAIQQGSNTCAGNPCQFLCLSTPVKHTCACPDNLKTVTGPNGAITCSCPNGEKLQDGKCVSMNTSCSNNQFRCANGICMPSAWRCDHDNDCGDNSDEKQCTYATCSPKQFECGSHRCIPNSWKCDGDHDCSDGSDERGCARSCAPDHFACNNSRCISKKWVCDGDNDCYDNSDEQGCSTPSTTVTTVSPASSCGPDKFRCKNGRCVPKGWFCDGYNDCSDGSDEPRNCTLRCHSWQFKCATVRRCILKFYKCDGANDCSDGSDEKDCPHPTTKRPGVTTVKPTTRCEFRCGSGECVRLADRCNGSPECMDRSDEKGCVVPTAFQCPGGYWRCRTDLACLTRKQLCDGISDCKDGSDEEQCETTPTGSTCLAFPFGFNCSDGEACFAANSYCDGKVECSNQSDEDPKYCKLMTRLDGLESTSLSYDQVRLTWRAVTLDSKVTGVYIEYIGRKGDGDSVVINPSIQIGEHSYVMKGLKACTKYSVAAAFKFSGVDKSRWIFRTIDFTTEVDQHPVKVNNIKFLQSNNHEGDLSWSEADAYCFGQMKTVHCTQVDRTLRNHTFTTRPPGTRVKLTKLVLAGHYNCTIIAEFHNLQNGQGFRFSNTYSFRMNVVVNKPRKHTGAPVKNQTLVWAIPVALVVLILVVVLVVVVFKYRNLQRSFLAFANRGYARASEEEEDMAVAFHSGEDAPMINRFSDDEPLVVA